MNILRYLIRNIILEGVFISRNFLRRSLTNLLFNTSKRAFQNKKNSNKILISRLDGKYGDSIVSQFMFEEIKKSLNAEIYVLTKNRQSIDFFSQFVDCFIICNNPRRMYKLFKSYQMIRNIHFNYVIDLGTRIADRELILYRYIKTNNLIVADTRVKFSDYCIDTTETKHFRQRCIDLLNLINIRTDSEARTKINIPSNHTDKIHNLLKEVKNVIYFNPYGAGSNRKLTPNNIDKVVCAVAKTFPNFSIIMQSIDHGKLQITKTKDNIYVFQTNNFVDICSLISLSVFVITVDTATSHAATALEKSSIVLYNSDKKNYVEWNADSKKSIPIFSKKEGVNINYFLDRELDEALIKIKPLL